MKRVDSPRLMYCFRKIDSFFKSFKSLKCSHKEIAPTPNLPNWSPSIFVLCLLVLIGKKEFIRGEKSNNFQNVVVTALFFLSQIFNFDIDRWSMKKWRRLNLNKPEIEKLQSHLGPGQLSHLTPSHPLVTKIQPFFAKALRSYFWGGRTRVFPPQRSRAHW